jgi:serine/threonine protein kinase
MSNPSPNLCPACGLPLPATAPRGLCPACLLKRGLDQNSQDLTAPTARDTSHWSPPSPETLGLIFPELEISRLLGRGGMGAVYLARQKALDRTVALKILPPSIATDPAFAERFTREAQAMARLNHAHIVTLYEFGTRHQRSPPPAEAASDTAPGAGSLYYFLMEYVDGMSLRALLDSGHIAPKEALAIVPQICDALQYAHDQGIVHRDIKPENILLNKQGQVKIADFGLAKLVGKAASQDASGEGASWLATSPPSMFTSPAGTPAYMAPEQLERPAEVDHRADIYSLGVVFYQMLTGELPTQRLELPSHKVEIDVRLDQIVLRALETSPELRFQNATQFKTEVETVISTSPRATSQAAAAAIATPSGAAPTRPTESAPYPAAAPLHHDRPKPHILAWGIAGAAALVAIALIIRPAWFSGYRPRGPRAPGAAPSAISDPTSVPTPPPRLTATYNGADFIWENFENGCSITKDGGLFHIAGTTTAGGWGHTNGIRSTTTFADGDFLVGVDFKQPRFLGNGHSLTYLRVSSEDGNTVGLLYQPGSYQLQRWTPRGFAGGIPNFGDEGTTFHRLTLKYDAAAQSLSGWVDTRFVGTINATLAGKRKVWLDANADTVGSQIDVTFDHLTILVGTPATGSTEPGTAATSPPTGITRFRFHLRRPAEDTTSPYFQRPNPWNPDQPLQLLATMALDDSALADAAFDPSPTNIDLDPVTGSPEIHVFLTPAGAQTYAGIPHEVEKSGNITIEKSLLYAFVDGQILSVQRLQSATNPAHLVLRLPPPASRIAAEQIVTKLKSFAGVPISMPPFRSPTDFLADLPAEARPDPQGWDPFSKPKADRWLDEHIACRGRRLLTDAIVQGVKVTRISPKGQPQELLRWDVELTLERIPLDFSDAHLKLKLDSYSLIDPNSSEVPLHPGASTVTFSGTEDFARRAKALKTGDRVRIEGVISKSSVWETNPPELWILLSDPKLILPPTSETAASGPATPGYPWNPIESGIPPAAAR